MHSNIPKKCGKNFKLSMKDMKELNRPSFKHMQDNLKS